MQTFFFKSKACPLNQKEYYLIYKFYNEPSNDSPVTGALFLGSDIDGYSKDFVGKKIVWKSFNFSFDGKSLKSKSIAFPFEKTYEYTYLKDVKKVLNSHGNEVTWIRLIDTPEGRPAWFNLSQAFADEMGNVVEKFRKESMKIEGLEHGKNFYISMNDFKSNTIEIEIMEEARKPSDKPKPMDHALGWVRGKYCFDKIQNGRLYFRVQYFPGIEKGLSTDPKILSGYEYLEKKYKDMPDQVYSINLDEYLKKGFLRFVKPGIYKCSFDSPLMNKGFALSDEDRKNAPTLPFPSDGPFIMNYPD